MLPRFSLLTLALIHIQTASADVYPTDYHSRVTGQFLTGHDQQLSGFVDGMVPVFKGSERFLFADGALMFGRDQRSVYSGGLGYRGIFNGPIGSGVGGAYVFGDYYHSSYSTTQWFLNPGLEWLGVSYEARLQAYVPLNSQNKVYGNTLAGNLPANVVTSSGQPSNLSGATGHRVFDTPVNLIEEYGPGGEIEIGRLFDVGKGIWFRVGGYHFSYQDLSNVNGVQANVEGIISRNISVILQNNYDNQNKNRFSIGVRISFGGSEAPMNSLDYRLTTPIIRHQARQSYGQVEPTWQTYKASGPSFDVFGGTSGRAGGWFFSPKGSAPPGSATTLESCTAEHPCRTIDSATAARIQQLEAGANLLFETGTYSIPKDSSNNFNWVNLQDGQSVLGRNPGWVTAASTSNRPAIEGGVFWGDASAGDSANGILRDTNVLNSNQRIPGSTTGLGIDSVIAAGAAGNFTVSKSNAAAEATQEGYIHAVGLFSGNNLTVSNSEQEVTVTSLNDLTEAYGLLARNTATVNDSSETIAAAGQSALLFGISADSVNANNVTQTITGTANSGTLTAKGISANNLVTANKANIAITASSESDVSVFGIDSGGSALIENSILDVESASNTKAQSNGINTVGDTTINNVEVKALAEAEMETVANGINAGGDATVTGGSQDAQANAQSVSALANGISANNLTAMNTSSTATATLATTTESENSAQAVGMSSINKMTVSDSSTIGTATVDSGNGFAQVYGMSSGGDLKATNIIQHSTSTTASGEAIAHGVFMSKNPPHSNVDYFKKTKI